MVNTAKRLLKPKVYDDTRHILNNSRVIPESGWSLCVSDYTRVKRTNNPTVNNSLNILYIDETSCSTLESIDYVSGRINQKRSALDTDFGEGCDSSLSGFLVGLGTTDYIMSKTNDRATTHTIIIKYYRGYNFIGWSDTTFNKHTWRGAWRFGREWTLI